MSLDVEKSRILTMRGLTKTRMKAEGVANANSLQACVVGMQVKLAFGAITRLCFTR
jgi:hypothetical protein